MSIIIENPRQISLILMYLDTCDQNLTRFCKAKGLSDDEKMELVDIINVVATTKRRLEYFVFGLDFGKLSFS